MTTNSTETFRHAMRRLTSAVSVVSVAEAGQRYGLTVTSVSSVSLSPPSLLLCVNHSASLHNPLVRAGAFCINVLHAHQEDVADAFSRPMPAAERFRFGAWDDAAGIPYLVSAQANVFCDLDAISSYGTHSIMVGKVRHAIVLGRIAPLLYENGCYTRSVLATALPG